jgi:hypothetical protein
MINVNNTYVKNGGKSSLLYMWSLGRRKEKNKTKIDFIVAIGVNDGVCFIFKLV